MEVQAAISEKRLRAKIGRDLDVLVDSVADGRPIARSAADAPEIDGVVHLERAGALAPGDFARVHVASAGAHDLYATLAA